MDFLHVSKVFLSDWGGANWHLKLKCILCDFGYTLCSCEEMSAGGAAISVLPQYLFRDEFVLELGRKV